MSIGETTFGTVIREAIEDAFLDVGVSIPGIVVSYSRARQTATVRPAVRRLVRDADDSDALLTEDRPVMYEVPVVWPSGGAGYWHPGLEEGDEVMVVCSDVDFSSWRATGATSDPSDKRPHRYASAVAFPCVRSRAKVLPDSDVMLAAGGETSSMMRAEAFSFFLGSLKNLLAADTSGPLTGPTIAGYIETALTALDTSTMAFASERIKTDELALPPPP